MRQRIASLLAACFALGCAMDAPAPPSGVGAQTASASANAGVASAAAPISAARVGELSRTLEKIRGRKFKREVAVNFVTFAQLRPRLVALFDAEMPAERLRMETEYLHALRLLPAGAELRKLYLQLLSAQVVGLYDPASRALFVVTDYQAAGGESSLHGLSGLNLTDIAIVHELDHALSDQYFSLDERFRKVRGRRDAEAALQALVEGEATLAMVQFALRETLGNGAISGSDPDAEGELLATVAGQLDPGSLMGLTAGDPSLRDMPPFLVQRLAASYADGLQYCLRAWRQGGWAAVDALYLKPPETTREILDDVTQPEALNPGAILREPDCAPSTAALRESPGAQDIRLWSFIQTGESPRAAGPPLVGDSRLAICNQANGARELRWIVAWNSSAPPAALRRAARKAWPASKIDWKPGQPLLIIAAL